MKKNFIAVFPVIAFAVLSVFGQQTQPKLYFFIDTRGRSDR